MVQPVISKKYDKLYDCSECGVLFATSHKFNKHIEKHLKIKKNKFKLTMVHQEEKIVEETKLFF